MVFQKRGTEYIFSKELERAEVWEEAVYAFYKKCRAAEMIISM